LSKASFCVVGFVVTQLKPENNVNSRGIRRDIRIVYWLCLIAAIVLALVYGFQSFYADFMYAFSNVIAPVVACVAVFSSFFALRRYWDKIGSRLSKIWLCFTLGMLLWFLGELGWAVYTMVLNVEVPYPSIADVFWLGGYVPLFIALLLYGKLFQPAISEKMFFTAGVIVAIVSMVVFSALMIPVLAEESQQDLVTLGINLAYPSLDLVLFLIAILGLLVFTFTRLKGRIGVAWHFINVAILFNVVADLTFSYTTLTGTYYNGHPQELLFHWGYLFFALAFYVHQREL